MSPAFAKTEPVRRLLVGGGLRKRINGIVLILTMKAMYKKRGKKRMKEVNEVLNLTSRNST